MSINSFQRKRYVPLKTVVINPRNWRKMNVLNSTEQNWKILNSSIHLYKARKPQLLKVFYAKLNVRKQN